MALSTVSAVLKRSGMGKLGRLGLEPAHRYERERPGELIHIDVKKLGRIVGGAGHRVIGSPGQRKAAGTRTDAAGVERKQVGWEYVHIAIDDTTRLAYAEVLTDERGPTTVGFLHRANRVLPAPRDHRSGCAHRQRQRRHLRRSRARVPCAPDQTPPHSSSPPPDQRQTRAVYPHDARRLGIRRDLPQQHRTHLSP